MSDPLGDGVSARLGDLERAERRRMMESRLVPLTANESCRKDESITLPVDLLVGRFHDVEGTIAQLRKDLGNQVQLMRMTSRRVELTLAMMILAAGAALFYLFARDPVASSRQYASLTPPAASSHR